MRSQKQEAEREGPKVRGGSGVYPEDEESHKGSRMAGMPHTRAGTKLR